MGNGKRKGERGAEKVHDWKMLEGLGHKHCLIYFMLTILRLIDF